MTLPKLNDQEMTAMSRVKVWGGKAFCNSTLCGMDGFWYQRLERRGLMLFGHDGYWRLTTKGGKALAHAEREKIRSIVRRAFSKTQGSRP